MCITNTKLTYQKPYSIHSYVFALWRSLLIYASSAQSDSTLLIPIFLTSSAFSLSSPHHHYHSSSSFSFHACCERSTYSTVMSCRWSMLAGYSHRNWWSSSNVSSDSRKKTMLLRSINHFGSRTLPAAVNWSTRRRSWSRWETDNCMSSPSTRFRDADL